MQDETGYASSSSFTAFPVTPAIDSEHEEENPRTVDTFVSIKTAAAASGNNRDSTNIIGNDMMAVAMRIQERARILQEEQKRSEVSKRVLLEVSQKRDIEKATNDRQRKHLLQTTNERNAVELQVLGVHESIGESHKRTQALEEESLESEERIHKLSRMRSEQTKSFYGPNLAKMETFVKVLKTIVDSKEKAGESKRKRLEDLRTKLDDSKKKNERICRETKEIEEKIEEEIGRKERVGRGGEDPDTDEGSTKSETSNKSGNSCNNNPTAIGREDEEITNLSKRVREAIEARSTLRKKLKLIQKKYNEANEDMLFWEGKHIRKMNTKKR